MKYYSFFIIYQGIRKYSEIIGGLVAPESEDEKPIDDLIIPYIKRENMPLSKIKKTLEEEAPGLYMVIGSNQNFEFKCIQPETQLFPYWVNRSMILNINNRIDAKDGIICLNDSPRLLTEALVELEKETIKKFLDQKRISFDNIWNQKESIFDISYGFMNIAYYPFVYRIQDGNLYLYGYCYDHFEKRWSVIQCVNEDSFPKKDGLYLGIHHNENVEMIPLSVPETYTDDLKNLEESTLLTMEPITVDSDIDEIKRKFESFQKV